MDFAPNTNVIGHAGRTFAIVEAGARPYELSNELETIGPCDFGGTLRRRLHGAPQARPADGELYAVSYFFGWGNDVEVTIIDAQARVRSSRRVAMGGPVSVHDCAITQRSIVLLDLPVTFSLDAAAAGCVVPLPLAGGVSVPHRPAAPRRRVDRGRLARRRAVLRVPPDERLRRARTGDGIVLDVVRHPSMFRTKHLGPDEGAPTLERWHLDGHGGAVKEERLDDRGQEFPRVDERRVGLPHRYGYAVAVGESDDILGTESVLLRHDFEQGTSVARSFGAGASLGEAVFVPRDDGADEADGWLLLLVHSADTAPPPCTSSTPTTWRGRRRP